MKILILIPTKESVNPETLKSAQAQFSSDGSFTTSLLIKTTPPKYFHSDPEKNRMMNIAENRRLIRKEALKTDADAFLWLDSDIVLPEGSLQRFYESGEPLIGAWCQMQNGWNIRLKDGKTYKEPLKENAEVEHVGFGALYMEREVLKKVDIRFDHNEPTKCECQLFCNDAEKLGYKPMVTAIYCKHNRAPIRFEIGIELLNKVKGALGQSMLPAYEVQKIEAEIMKLKKLSD